MTDNRVTEEFSVVGMLEKEVEKTEWDIEQSNAQLAHGNKIVSAETAKLVRLNQKLEFLHHAISELSAAGPG